MTDQQLQGVVFLLLGLAALIVSGGVAWQLSRASRAQRVESSWFITLVSFALLLVGAALAYSGVSKLIEGGA
jgi:hypothetical protein